MVAPEGSCSDNCDAEWMRGGHYFFSDRVSMGASTA
jgi:hypothetical protein